MPVYNCECCRFTSSIKTHYTKHLLTPKHIENANQPTTPTEPDNIEKICDNIYDEVMAMKDAFKILNHEMSEIKTANRILHMSLEECKHMIMYLKMPSPTYAPQTQATPQSIVINQPPSEEKKSDETCNPRYIETQFNEDLKYSGTPCIDAFFSIKSDNVVFDFEEVDDMEVLASKGHGYVYEHIKKYITKMRSEGVELPFAYYKSSWYIKTEDGWKRQEKVNNKNLTPDKSAYQYDYVPSKFLFIMRNRLTDHIKDIFGKDATMTHGWSCIVSDVLEKHHNRDVVKAVIEALE